MLFVVLIYPGVCVAVLAQSSDRFLKQCTRNNLAGPFLFRDIIHLHLGTDTLSVTTYGLDEYSPL